MCFIVQTSLYLSIIFLNHYGFEGLIQTMYIRYSLLYNTNSDITPDISSAIEKKLFIIWPRYKLVLDMVPKDTTIMSFQRTVLSNCVLHFSYSYYSPL